MLQLPNGCSCSTPSVFPKNWKTGGSALMQVDWRIQYYFRDPSNPDCPKQGKLKVIKGMNSFKTLAERRLATKKLLDNEIHMLVDQGYNPLAKSYMAPEIVTAGSIAPGTPFIPALHQALSHLSVINHTSIEIKSIINSVEAAARDLGLSKISVDHVARKHIKAILAQCGKTNPKWSNNRFNKFRGYLMMLFKELVEQEAVPANPLRDIAKKPTVKKIKKTLTLQQRKDIDESLAERFPEFRNFIHLFFHSGGRKPELLQLKPGMVNLERQVYRCVVKKRKDYTEVERTIKTIAIPFWKYFLENCPDDHFIFGPRFKPGLKPMGQEMPTNYWKEYVKQNLGIDVDFYSLKHLNTTEVVDALDEEAAAELNAHTSTAMVVAIYDVKQKQREHKRLKDLGNTFV